MCHNLHRGHYTYENKLKNDGYTHVNNMADQDRIVQLISSKTVKSGEFNCLIWQGARWGTSGYGKIAIDMHDGTGRKYFRAHRIAYALRYHSGTFPAIPSHDNTGSPVEISHLCNNKLCLNTEHLTLESHMNNMERMSCFAQGHCIKAHSPYCLIM